MPTPTVVDLRSLSYTGTTWLNLLVGSHPDVFTLGLPQRAYAARSGRVPSTELCRVHGEDCGFWPDAISSMRRDPAVNLYRQVAEAAQVTHVAINNPFVDPQGIVDVQDPHVQSVTLAVVRDPRAVAWSYRRRHGGSARDAAQWVIDHAYLAPVSDHPVIQYESVAEDPQGFLLRVGDLVGLDYALDAVDYFRYDHHPAGGNPTPIGVIVRHESGRAASDDMVEARYQAALTSGGRAEARQDWRRFGAEELQEIEAILEPVAARWGYR